MSRVFRSESLHSQRKRRLRLLAYTLRALLLHNKRDTTARDMLAYATLLLDEIQGLVNTTVTSWERKGFWLKADRFRLEWAWVGEMRDALLQALQKEDWETLTALAAQLFGRISRVDVPKRMKDEQPWQGAWHTLQERARLGRMTPSV